MRRKVGLLVADAHYLFYKGLVDLNLASILRVHHLKHLEFQKVVIRVRVANLLGGLGLFIGGLIYETAILV